MPRSRVHGERGSGAMSIFLVRHGETAGNAERVVQHADTPLSDVGLAQARSLARRLAEHGVKRILSSDYARAAMTAEAVRKETAAPLSHHPELRERHYGELRGRPYSEVGEYILKEGYEPPGGESWETFHARVDRAWERVCEAADPCSGNLAVFTHGLVCFSLAQNHLRLPEGTAAPMKFGNTSLTVIDPAPPWTVQLLGCCEHLKPELAHDGDRPSGI